MGVTISPNRRRCAALSNYLSHARRDLHLQPPRPGFLVLNSTLARYMVEKECCKVVLLQGSVLEWNQCLSMLLSSAARAAASRSPRARPLARTAGWRSQAGAARLAPPRLGLLPRPGSRLIQSRVARPPLPEVSAVRATAVRPCTGQGASLRPAALAPMEAAAAHPFGDPRLAIHSGQAGRGASPARATDSQALAMRPPAIRGRKPVRASLPPAGAARPAIKTRPHPIKADQMTSGTHLPATEAPQTATETCPAPIKTCRMTIGTGPAPGTAPPAIKVHLPAIDQHLPVGVGQRAIAMRPPMSLKRQPATTMMTWPRRMAGARHFAALRGQHGSKARLARRQPTPAASPIMTSLRRLTSRRGRPCSHRRVGARERR